MCRMAPSAVACFVGVLSAVLLAQVSADTPIVLPHSTCKLVAIILRCQAGNYSIPGNFNQSLISPTARWLYIGSGATSSGLTSYLHDDAEPLSNNLSNLTTLNLYKVEGTNSSRLPLEKFLANVKGQLTSLTLMYCRINPLGTHFLNGFTNLGRLSLFYNDILEIDINAFHTGINLPDGSPPSLTVIDLQQNVIGSLDWAVFAPVAASLQTLNLNNQQHFPGGLKNLTLSKSFTFANLSSLSLENNRLDFLPRSILDTLTICDKAVIKLDRNAFCPAPNAVGCECCEAEDFVKWTHEIANGSLEMRPTLTFTCGASFNSWSITPTETKLPRPYLNQCCSNSSAPGCADEQTTGGPELTSKTPPTPNSSDVMKSKGMMVSFLLILTLPFML